MAGAGAGAGRRSLGRRLSRALASAGRGPRDSGVARFRGLSLRWLADLRDGVLRGTAAAGVRLLVLHKHSRLHDGRVLPAGTTLRLCKTLRDGFLRCATPEGDSVDISGLLVRDKARIEWTIADVWLYTAAPQTRDDGLVMLDILAPGDRGARFQGTFVTLSDATLFDVLVDALLEHFEQHRHHQRKPSPSAPAENDTGIDLGSQYVWLDIFCALTGPRTPRKLDKRTLAERERFYKSDVHEAIGHFDNYLIFMNSWLDPLPLWELRCLWELFGALRAEKKIQLLFRSGDQGLFVRELVWNVRPELQRLVRHLNRIGSEAVEPVVEDQAPRGFTHLSHRVSSSRGFVRAGSMNRALAAPASDMGEEDCIKRAASETGPLGLLGFQIELSKFIFRDALRKFVDAALESTAASEAIPSRTFLMYEAGRVLELAGDLDGALTIFTQALHASTKQDDAASNDQVIALVLHQVALLLAEQGFYDEAMQHMTRALGIREKEFHSQNNPLVTFTIIQIAEVKQLMGDLAGALEMLEEVLKIEQSTFRSINHINVASVLICMAHVKRLQGDLDDAVALIERATLVQLNLFHSETHFSMARSVSAIAHVHYDQGQLELALSEFEQVLGMQEAHFETRENRSVATTLSNIASVVLDLGDVDGAITRFESVLAISDRCYGTRSHLQVATAIHNLGFAHALAGRRQEAIRLYQESLDIKRRLFGAKSHPSLPATLLRLGVALCESGHADLGEDHIIRAEQILHAGTAMVAPATRAQLEVAKAGHAASLSKWTNAVGHLEAALELIEARTGSESNLEIAAVQARLGRALLKSGDLARGRQVLSRALTTRRAQLQVNGKHVSESHPWVEELTSMLAGAQ